METLRDKKFRFVRRGFEFKWVHPAEKLPADLDCTDMDDYTFERVVLKSLHTPYPVDENTTTK